MNRPLPAGGPPAGLQGVLLIIIVAAIALGVVAMHQLSSHHTFTLPQQRHSAAHQADAHHANMDTTGHDHLASQSDPGPGMPGQNAAAGIACADCGQHALMVSCLLALTLLVLGWLLQRPPWRARPPNWNPHYPQRIRTPILSQPRCLSLLELSISRT